MLSGVKQCRHGIADAYPINFLHKKDTPFYSFEILITKNRLSLITFSKMPTLTKITFYATDLRVPKNPTQKINSLTMNLPLRLANRCIGQSIA